MTLTLTGEGARVLNLALEAHLALKETPRLRSQETIAVPEAWTLTSNFVRGLKEFHYSRVFRRRK